MQRKFIGFRLRDDVDSDIMAAVQNISSNETVSAMCRQGLREVLNLKFDEKDRDSIEMIISGRSIEDDYGVKPDYKHVVTQPITVKSKPAIFIPKKKGGGAR